MDDFRDLAKHPEHRRRFEHMLHLAAQRGDADLVAERLYWGVDPNCTFAKNRTPLLANVRGACPSAATIRVLLDGAADPASADEAGLTALDYARRKLSRLDSRAPRPRRKSPSLDENNQLNFGKAEQHELDKMRQELPDADHDFLRIYWQERLRAARRVFNDPEQLEQIVDLLEAHSEP